MFALFGYGLANLFKFLSDLFKGLADALNDSGDPENQPVRFENSFLLVPHMAFIRHLFVCLFACLFVCVSCDGAPIVTFSPLQAKRSAAA